MEYTKDLHHALLRMAEGDQPQFMTDELSATIMTLRAKGLITWDSGQYQVTSHGHGYLDTWDRWHPEILLEGGSSDAA